MLSKLLAGIVMDQIDFFGFAKTSGEQAGECQDISTFMLASQVLTVLHLLVLQMFELLNFHALFLC